MQNTNVTSLRKNLFGFLERTIKYNEHINVSTKDGNAIIKIVSMWSHYEF